MISLYYFLAFPAFPLYFLSFPKSGVQYFRISPHSDRSNSQSQPSKNELRCDLAGYWIVITIHHLLGSLYEIGGVAIASRTEYVQMTNIFQMTITFFNLISVK